MIEVYHLNDKDFFKDGMASREQLDPRYYDANIGFKPERQSKAVIDLFNEGHYQLVAKVEGDSLDNAWEKTNHIEDSWLKNSNVQPMVGEARSSKVGDVMKDESGTYHIVASVGFTPIPEGSINDNKRKMKP